MVCWFYTHFQLEICMNLHKTELNQMLLSTYYAWMYMPRISSTVPVKKKFLYKYSLPIRTVFFKCSFAGSKLVELYTD